MAFKTADELGLPQTHLDALIKTLELLQNSSGRLLTKIDTPDGPHQIHFNMNNWNSYHACGSVCCIGGTAEKIGGVEFTDVAANNQNIEDLFYPIGLHGASEWNAVTPAQAASVLSVYLDQGVVDWSRVIEQIRENA